MTGAASKTWDVTRPCRSATRPAERWTRTGAAGVAVPPAWCDSLAASTDFGNVSAGPRHPPDGQVALRRGAATPRGRERPRGRRLRGRVGAGRRRHACRRRLAAAARASSSHRRALQRGGQLGGSAPQRLPQRLPQRRALVCHFWDSNSRRWQNTRTRPEPFGPRHSVCGTSWREFMGDGDGAGRGRTTIFCCARNRHLPGASKVLRRLLNDRVIVRLFRGACVEASFYGSCSPGRYDLQARALGEVSGRVLVGYSAAALWKLWRYEPTPAQHESTAQRWWQAGAEHRAGGQRCPAGRGNRQRARQGDDGPARSSISRGCTGSGRGCRGVQRLQQRSRESSRRTTSPAWRAWRTGRWWWRRRRGWWSRRWRRLSGAVGLLRGLHAHRRCRCGGNGGTLIDGSRDGEYVETDGRESHGASAGRAEFQPEEGEGRADNLPVRPERFGWAEVMSMQAYRRMLDKLGSWHRWDLPRIHW